MTFTPSARSHKRTSTPRYDPAIRDYVVDAAGLTEDVHPVDQRVALLLFTLKGKIAGDPTLGLESVGRSGTEASKALWVRKVAFALDPAIVDGDIELVSIDVAFPKRGETSVVVSYHNLRLPRPGLPRRAPFTFGGG